MRTRPPITATRTACWATPANLSRASMRMARCAGRGCRPATPDSLPVIGRSPRHPTFLIAFGHGHLGLTFAAVTGQLIAELAAGRPTSVEISPFRADGF